jgi:hypothetical protein
MSLQPNSLVFLAALPTSCVMNGTKGDGSVISTRVSGKKELKERTGRKLKEEHIMFIIELIDKKPSIVLEQVKDELSDKFADLTISISGIQKHMVEICRFSLKDARAFMPKIEIHPEH